ncbi:MULTISPECIES: hypothetical protein [unclassified Bradyrhizobium]
MLEEEITKTKRLVRTDAYQMSIGEIVSMYDEKEIIVDPEFQRLFLTLRTLLGAPMKNSGACCCVR